MAGFMNITGTTVNDDPSYRYKMPRLQAKTEGRGNGIKTVIMNMTEIADALARPPSLPTKFFGTELGAQSRWEADAEKATVNGVHSAADLQKLMNIFIDKFVLCPNCHLPETALVVKKGIIKHKCSACGAKEPVDMSHKLCTFILKEAAAVQAEREKDKKARKERKEKKAKEAAEKAGTTVTAAAPATTATAAPSVATTAAATGAGTKARVEESSDEEEEEEEEVEEKPTAPKAAPAPAVAPAAASAKTSLFDSPAVSELRSFVAKADKPSREAFVAEAKRVQGLHNLPLAQRSALFFVAVARGGQLVDALKNEVYLETLKHLTFGRDGAKPADSQKELLAALQHLLVEEYASDAAKQGKYAASSLQQLYNGDALEEDAIVAWYESGQVNASIKDKVALVVKWLQEAEEEDDE